MFWVCMVIIVHSGVGALLSSLAPCIRPGREMVRGLLSWVFEVRPPDIKMRNPEAYGDTCKTRSNQLASFIKSVCFMPNRVTL